MGWDGCLDLSIDRWAERVLGYAASRCSRLASAASFQIRTQTRTRPGHHHPGGARRAGGPGLHAPRAADWGQPRARPTDRQPVAPCLRFGLLLLVVAVAVVVVVIDNAPEAPEQRPRVVIGRGRGSERGRRSRAGGGGVVPLQGQPPGRHGGRRPHRQPRRCVDAWGSVSAGRGTRMGRVCRWCVVEAAGVSRARLFRLPTNQPTTSRHGPPPSQALAR